MHPLITRALLLTFGVVLGAMLIVIQNIEVHATPVAKFQEPGCKPFSTVGTVIVSRCVDEAGNVLFINSAGFMTYVSN